MTSPNVLYWYEDYWMHRLYCEGLDRWIASIQTLPIEYGEKNDGTIKNIDCMYFYWRILPRLGGGVQPLPEVIEIEGYRLFGKVKETEEDFRPVVEIRKCNKGDSFQLYSARDFEIGDAILFISTIEEKSKQCVLGGAYARISDDTAESNAYLTNNRTLRCLKSIEKGDEIVRWNSKGKIIKYLEKVDQVLVSPDRMVLGKIGKEAVPNSNPLIHFPDDTIEMLGYRHCEVIKDK